MPNKKYLNQRKLDLIATLGLHKFDGYIIPSTDEFFNEYVPDHLNRLKYITGFTGSNGVAIITKHKCVFFTDSRYTLQAAKELEGYEVYDMYQESSCSVYGSLFQKGMKLGYDATLMRPNELEYYQKLAKEHDFSINPSGSNIVDEIWERDKPHSKEVMYLEMNQAGATVSEKLAQVIKELKHDAYLVTDPCAVCWLLNIRGGDVPYNPIVLSKAVIAKDGIVHLFTDCELPSTNILLVCKLDEYFAFLATQKNVFTDRAKVSVAEQNALEGELHFGLDIIDTLKARKNNVELENFVDAHIKDGVALTKALYELFNMEHLPTEHEFGELLLAKRKEQHGFLEESFAPIVGYAENGAIIHYRANAHECSRIGRNNLLLLDSGGHYMCGTTDVTRTVHLGAPSKEHIKHFTLVLKGMIALTLARFPDGTNGMALDVLARSPLWSYGLNFGHGTSHGVGCTLSVHESPPRIGQGYNAHNKLRAGMVLSNEPGYYKEDDYGIRIENLLYIRGSDFLEFETLTLVPIQMNLVDVSLLEKRELNWLKNYNEKVFATLSQHLTDNEIAWLRSYIAGSV